MAMLTSATDDARALIAERDRDLLVWASRRASADPVQLEEIDARIDALLDARHRLMLERDVFETPEA